MTDKLRPILEAYLAGSMPANIALMRLCIEAASPEEVRAAIDDAALSARGAGPLSRVGEGQGEGGALSGKGGPSPHPSPKGRGGSVAHPASAGETPRLKQLADLLDRHGSAWATIREVMAEAEHDRAPGGHEDPVAHWGAVFDRLARRAPEAGVALYALGSPELLAAATAEVVERMRDWGLLGTYRHMLEIGCGIGRLSLALAPELAGVIGLDLSGEMIAEARRRGAGVPNASFRQTSGRDLTGIPDGSVDLVLAADTFPYLVAAGQGLAENHVAEVARVLKPGGALLVLNYSYRCDDERDRREFREAAQANGLHVDREGTRDFTLWDGTTFLARKP